MLRRPFLSVIIPTFNSGLHIRRCCLSILTQELQDYEIIIQDAFSSDNTIELLSELKRLNPTTQINIFREKDKGIYDAMNKGIKRARGEWIYILGSDDELYNNDVFRHIHNVSDNTDADVIYGNVLSERLSGVYDGEFTPEKLFEKNICHQAVFMKRKVYEELGYFNLKYKAYGDWEHNMRWFFSGKIKKHYVDVIVANYADGGYSSQFGDRVFERDKVLRYLILGRRNLRLGTKLRKLRSLTGYALSVRDYKLLVKLLFYTPLILL